MSNLKTRVDNIEKEVIAENQNTELDVLWIVGYDPDCPVEDHTAEEIPCDCKRIRVDLPLQQRNP